METVIVRPPRGRCDAGDARSQRQRRPRARSRPCAMPTRASARCSAARGGERPRERARGAGDVDVRRRRRVPQRASGSSAAWPRSRELRERGRNVVVARQGRPLQHRPRSRLRAGSMLEMADCLVTGALARTESRGAHTRLDYPERDDERWMRHIADLERRRAGASRLQAGHRHPLPAAWSGATRRRAMEVTLKIRRSPDGASHQLETLHGRRARDGHRCSTRWTRSRTSTTARSRYRKSCRMAVCGSCGMRMDGGAVPGLQDGHEAASSRAGTMPVDPADGQPAGDQGPGRRHGAVLGQVPRDQVHDQRSAWRGQCERTVPGSRCRAGRRCPCARSYRLGARRS